MMKEHTPRPDDRDAWRSVIAKQDAMVPVDAPEMMVMSLTGAVASGHLADILARDVEGVPVHVATPQGTAPDDRRVFLSLHGGAGGTRLTEHHPKIILSANGCHFR
ncbi:MULTISPECIES: hypothetical protein [unclassified Nonomuraea]|uniref:hypothetical protein n=1 Tax=unclassified Nonomuraea TaxID=2593643 RepID=UPI0033F5806B